MRLTLEIPEAEFHRYEQYYKPYIVIEKFCQTCNHYGGMDDPCYGSCRIPDYSLRQVYCLNTCDKWEG